MTAGQLVTDLNLTLDGKQRGDEGENHHHQPCKKQEKITEASQPYRHYATTANRLYITALTLLWLGNVGQNL